MWYVVDLAKGRHYRMLHAWSWLRAVTIDHGITHVSQAQLLSEMHVNSLTWCFYYGMLSRLGVVGAMQE